MREFSEGLPGKIQGNRLLGRTLNRDGEIAEEDDSAGDESAEPAGTLLSHKCRVIILLCSTQLRVYLSHPRATEVILTICVTHGEISRMCTRTLDISG